MSQWKEPTIKSERIYSGTIIDVKVDTVRLPNGNIAKRELVEHPGAVAVLPLTEDHRLVLVEQFRKPLEKVTMELPAGKLDAGEDPLDCAKRELIEETGYTANIWYELVTFYTSPGFANEQIYLYAAKDLQAGKPQPDDGEFVTTKEVTLGEAFKYIDSGHICDAKTVLAIYAWENQQLKNKVLKNL